MSLEKGPFWFGSAKDCGMQGAMEKHVANYALPRCSLAANGRAGEAGMSPLCPLQLYHFCFEGLYVPFPSAPIGCGLCCGC